MRVTHLLLAVAIFSATLTPALCPTLAAAQQGPASVAPAVCTGSVNVVRISDIKPGKMATFLQAVAAQKTWYKNAGTSDQIEVMRIMEQDPATKAYSFSETQAITTHLRPTTQTNSPAHDPGYDAFVAMFKESSTIKTEYITCIAQ